jgi:hypothetical protein
MQAPNIAAGRLVSVDAGWTAGMNTVRHPWLLRPDQYRRAVNVVNRGGVAQTRPGFAHQLTLPSGNLQGMCHFTSTKESDDETDYLVFAVNGSVYAAPFPLAQPKDWDFFKIESLSFDPNVSMVYFCVAEKTVTTLSNQAIQLVPSYNILMVQDGINEAGYWDGFQGGHLKEAEPSLQTPRGTWMAFSGGRLWVARGKVVVASDLFDPLKFAERTTGSSRGDFLFSKDVTGLVGFVGDNRAEILTVFTESRSEVIQAGIRDRTKWASTPNFQSILFPSTGCVAGRSITFQSGLMWWYSSGGLVSSDAAASSNLTSQINFRDAEMAFSKQSLASDQSGICSLSFENYLLVSAPVNENLNSETFVLDYATMSEASAEKIPAWSSVWTGIRPVQWVSANIANRRRAFAASVDYSALSDGSHNHIWEAFMPEREDSFFELGADNELQNFRRPIYCEFETRLMGDGHDLKVFLYSDINLIEIAGDVSLRVDYRGLRGSYKNVLCKEIIAPISIEDAGANITEDLSQELGELRKQSRRVITEYGNLEKNCPTCENENVESIDKAFSLLIRWCGQLAVESIRLFMEPHPERSDGRCEENETKVCIVDEQGVNHSYKRADDFITTRDRYEKSVASIFISTQSYRAERLCPSPSVTGPVVVNAVATYRSKVSQDDADLQALAIAQKAAEDQLAVVSQGYPCYYDSVKFAPGTCSSVLNEEVNSIAAISDKFVLVGNFWFDNTRLQGKITAKELVNGGRLTNFTPVNIVSNGFVNTPFNPLDPSASYNVYSIASYSDGSSICVGDFQKYAGENRIGIVKITSSGTLSTAVTFGAGFPSGTARKVKIANDGQSIFVSGTFTSYDGNSGISPIIKLNANGTVAKTYSIPFVSIRDFIEQPDGKLVIAGFTTNSKISVRRLNVDGTDDSSFTHYEHNAPDNNFYALALQADGKIIFSSIGINSNKNIVRLLANGTVDSTFNVGSGFGSGVAARSITIDATGNVYAVGSFISYNGTPRNRIVKILPNGAIDSSFIVGSGFDDVANQIIINSAKLIVVGKFTEYDGEASSRFARLDFNGTFIDSFFSYSIGGVYRSEISQADADAQALIIAQDYVNSGVICE